MVNKDAKLGVRQQCELLKLSRSRIYYQSKFVDDSCLANMIAQIYERYPVYGYRRITACLRRENLIANGKCVLRLMQEMGIRAIYPGPKTTIRNKTDNRYPYLLKKIAVTKPHQAWQVDITYLRTDHGFMYMNALIDMRTRYVVGWSLSNSLDVESCIRSLEKAIADNGIPDIVNSDQGSQFTCGLWINALGSSGILISMSGKGRSNDNAQIERLWRTLKYEWTILNGARSVADYKKLLPEFIHWYNYLRPHQALNYQTPAEVLKGKPYEYVDKAKALPHILTRPTTMTDVKDSLNL